MGSYLNIWQALRLEFEGALYHLCARGNRRERIFADEGAIGSAAETTTTTVTTANFERGDHYR